LDTVTEGYIVESPSVVAEALTAGIRGRTFDLD